MSTDLRPMELLAALGLHGDQTIDPPIDDTILSDLETRRRGLELVHLSTRDVEISTISNLISSSPSLQPPRSGHIGNWGDIALGRSGMIDYNKSISMDRPLGQVWMLSFTETETHDLSSGDAIYLPGSVVRGGKRRELDLFTWNGSELTKRSRENSLFVPFVWTEISGSLVPLSELHLSAMESIDGLSFKSISALLLEQSDLVVAILTELIERATKAPSPDKELEAIFGGAMGLDGIRSRKGLAVEGNNRFRIGDALYEGALEIARYALWPVRAAVEPGAFLEAVPSLPSHLPVISNLCLAGLFGMLNTHYGDCDIDRATMTQPFNPHLHWGAVGMAGYPPKRRGYLGRRRNLRALRTMSTQVVSNFAEIDPILFVLMPACIFSLCPTDAHPDDAELVEDLLALVHRETDNLRGEPENMLRTLEREVAGWCERRGDALSSYFVNRFSTQRSVHNSIELPSESTSLWVTGFESLTTRQASILVGCLFENLSAVGAEMHRD